MTIATVTAPGIVSSHWSTNPARRLTTEGWGNYIASASWYEPNNAGCVPIAWGRSFDTATLQFTASGIIRFEDAIAGVTKLIQMV